MLKHVNTNEELNVKSDISSFVKMRYLELKIKENRENNKKVHATFDHNFNNIPYM